VSFRHACELLAARFATHAQPERLACRIQARYLPPAATTLWIAEHHSQDATWHGSATRVNPRERRHRVYRYGSAWNRTRFGYHASPQLLARLNPVARKVVHPQEYIRPPDAAARW